tara:strand:- start:368 stop:763 length:396 start_codon:yes stop_codon:yes gene_type:complete
MATLTTTLTMTSADAFAHQPINISTNIALAVEAPYTDLSRVAAPLAGYVDIVGTGGGDVIYFYIKNTAIQASNGAIVTHKISVRNANSEQIATLGANEFLFIPVSAAEGIEIGTPTGAAVFAEYLYFTKDV